MFKNISFFIINKPKIDFFEHLWYNVYTFEMGVFQMNSFIVTQSRIKENELLKSVEEFSKKLYSTFDLIFDELRIHNKNAEFTPNNKGLDCGTIKTFNFKLTKEELSSDNNKYIFQHGNNTVTLEEKFPLCGVVTNKDGDCYITELSKQESIIDYLNLVKKYLDYYVLDRDSTYILKDGKIISDQISDQDFKNRELNGYSYINK